MEPEKGSKFKALNYRTYERCERENVHIITLENDNYPPDLARIYEPPPVLYVKGEVENLKTLGTALAIVGSRSADKVGCQIAEEIAADASRDGICIISGLALGIDTAAHKGALAGKQHCPTIAVLGHGLATPIYPTKNRELADEILRRGGLLISQYAPDILPFASNFLDRNRIIAGLSRATLVVQAPKRSGALSTARYALEEGRDVLVVPGCIRDPRYDGSNRLLQQGAYVISNYSDLEEFFPELKKSKSSKGRNSRSTESNNEILSILKEVKEIHYEELAKKFSDRTILDKDLLELELSGSINRIPGNMIALKRTSSQF